MSSTHGCAETAGNRSWQSKLFPLAEFAEVFSDRFGIAGRDGIADDGTDLTALFFIEFAAQLDLQLLDVGEHFGAHLFEHGGIAREAGGIEPLHLADEFLNLLGRFGVFAGDILAQLIEIAEPFPISAFEPAHAFGELAVAARSAETAVVEGVVAIVAAAVASAALRTFLADGDLAATLLATLALASGLLGRTLLLATLLIALLSALALLPLLIAGLLALLPLPLLALPPFSLLALLALLPLLTLLLALLSSLLALALLLAALALLSLLATLLALLLALKLLLNLCP